MSDRRDIIVTWPQTKPLLLYLDELRRAQQEGLVINYRIGRLPVWDDAIEDHGYCGWPYGVVTPRCFMVHSGHVRGWCHILGTCYREEGEVSGWPAGFYIVREPEWYPLDPQPSMLGFQGWRWLSQELGVDTKRRV